MIPTLLQPIGTIVGGIGAFWFLCDRRANGPGYLIFFGLVSLITGGALS